jgi:hypothetical protein
LVARELAPYFLSDTTTSPLTWKLRWLCKKPKLFILMAAHTLFPTTIRAMHALADLAVLGLGSVALLLTDSNAIFYAVYVTFAWLGSLVR